MPPLHVGAAAQADLDGLADGLGSHASILGQAHEEDGYDCLSGAVAEWLGRGLQSLVQQFESARRLLIRGRAPVRTCLNDAFVRDRGRDRRDRRGDRS